MSDRSRLLDKFAAWLVNLPRHPKRALLFANDFLLLSIALWLGFSLRLNTLYVPPTTELLLLLASAPVIGLATFHFMGLYRLVTRYIGPRGAMRIFLAVGLAVLLWILVVTMSGAKGTLPRSSMVMYWIFAAGLVWLSREVAGAILRNAISPSQVKVDRNRKAVLIFGAGATGVQLLRALRRGSEYDPVGFIDESKSMWGQFIGGLKVYRPEKIPKMIHRYGVVQVLLAMPEAPAWKHREVLRKLERHRLMVKTLPAMEDIASGRVAVSDLRNVDAVDLLGRDPVPPIETLLHQDIRAKSVMVTGAGGTIGSELTRQILAIRPTRLVLFELSEVALYEIETELQELLTKLELSQGNGWADGAAGAEVEIVPILGNVRNARLVRQVITEYGIETIYHAAAYKHVPIVETNPVAGIANNTFGTLEIARAAAELGVARFVLVSTDKAVRPTNIMGASKRLGELILQAFAHQPDCETVFTMVRFGNVLDSSGSVVRRFRKQIRNGGPVTVTHQEIIRYFMSIPEAAQLVLQAGAMAKGGEVFVLDMGEPIKIDSLARSMITLMGLRVRDGQSPDGDIEIVYTGLRQGEKLYEELLIGQNSTGTEHPRILRNEEPWLAWPQLETELIQLKAALEGSDRAAIHAILSRTVEGYRSDWAGGKRPPLAASTPPALPRVLH